MALRVESEWIWRACGRGRRGGVWCMDGVWGAAEGEAYGGWRAHGRGRKGGRMDGGAAVTLKLMCVVRV